MPGGLPLGLALGCGSSEEPARGPEAAAVEGHRTRQLVNFGEDLKAAVEIAPGIFQSRGTSNAQLVVTPKATW